MRKDHLKVRKRIGDVETPVGAMLKLGPDHPGSFLFESIHGGERLGRYSFIGHGPRTWFRILDGKAETATKSDFSDAKPADGDTPVDALKIFVESAKAQADEDLPPMASGAFGYIGYDMIQHVEPVTIKADKHLDVPEVLLVIPSVVIIFDHLYQQILLVGRIFDGDEAGTDVQLDAVEQKLASVAPLAPTDQAEIELTFQSGSIRPLLCSI